MKVVKQLISQRFSVENSEALMNSYQSSQTSFISEVKSRLENGKYNLSKSNCPCGVSRTRDIIISEIDRYGLPLNSVICMKCGTVRVNPYLDSVSLDDFYSKLYQKMYGRAPDLESYFCRQKSYGEKVFSISQAYLNSESWVCEVGCGAGGALSIFQDQNINVVGCDYSRDLIEDGKKRGIPNLYHGGIEELKNSVDSKRFDLIFLHHVFEHLDNPFVFLNSCRDIVNENGKIVIIVPDISGIDSSRFPAGDLLPYLHIAHKYNFSLKCLQNLSERSGYSLSVLHPDPKLKTPCSDSSELWVEMKMIASDTYSSDFIESPLERGEEMLNYLIKTEKLYSLGLCNAQIAKKIERLQGRIFPIEKLRKIKAFLMPKDF
jgi:2-polyprenyl-3-methyl-5-hydroxy-6-metoxy-1,4-benzoquinol methylase